MATASFLPYIEKENVESLHKSRLESTSRQRGKVFQSNTKSSFETTRKALGNVNIDPSVKKPSDQLKKPGLKPLGLKPVDSLPQKKPVQKKPVLQSKPPVQLKKPFSSKSGNIQNSAQPGKRHKLKAAESTKTQPFKIHEDDDQFDEIENMFITTHNDDNDDYEDIWPKKERPSSYIGQFFSWRPPCLFGREESDSEEEPDLILEPIELPEMPLRPNPLEFIFDEGDGLGIESIGEIEEIALPSLPELDESIPLTLNDSLDISFRNGSLELKN